MDQQRAFERVDSAPDAEFYRQPRFVEHIDAGAIAAVTQLYRETFVPGDRILDLMSSWVSHLPPEVAYGDIVGVGMNAAELQRNPRLARWIVHDLNAQPRLPFAAQAFDGAAICVSIQYLMHPVEVLAEVARVLRSGAPLVITFSNRCFPTKAVAIWRALDATGQLALVERYLRAAGWTQIKIVDRRLRFGDPLFCIVARTEHSNAEAAT